MQQRLSCSFLVVAMLVPWVPALRQTANSTQQAVIKSDSQKRYVPDERLLLVKARQGDTSAQWWLGTGYEQGWFGMPDYRQALKWLRKSAEKGDPDAQNALGQMYENGEGVTQNYTIAAKWYKKAAEHVPDLGGAGQGRNNLGLLYLNGHGVPKDYVQAYMWLSLFSDTNFSLSSAKGHMTPSQIVEAERLVAEWKSKHSTPE
jgi:TPR repeat protein